MEDEEDAFAYPPCEGCDAGPASHLVYEVGALSVHPAAVEHALALAISPR